ncbi:MAG TPA: carbon-nitrogen hydrolase family protein, partial [Candidatus Yonathbacteria bacterium]|nr:carbon-nitrogen hydrolase family protein [Candidatus Yonathbacteria bacterium]
YSAYPEDESDVTAWESKSIWAGHELYEKYLGLAREVGVAFVFTFLESNKERIEFYNTAEVIDKKGESILRYRKTHTVDKGWESMFVAGESFDVAELETTNGMIKVGVMICYDREFPEVARLLMLEGAELILTPNACNLEDDRIAQFQTRASENMLAVAMVNYPKPKLNGMSVAFDGMRKKKGEEYNPILVKLGDEEEIAITKIDIEALRAYRGRGILGDTYRRPHLYKKLSENNPKPPFIRKNARR